MDNYIKHLLDKIPADKKITKDNKTTISISLKIISPNAISYLKSISEIYKLCSELVEYIKTPEVHVLHDEIIIIY